MLFSGFSLSDYINGGAELYLAYGFREVAVTEFRSDAGSRLTVEVYLMSSPENAYGVFSTDRAGEHWPLGADSSYGDGLLRFWKGPYFVRVLCFPMDSSLEPLLRNVGEQIAERIGEESRRPTILNVLPENGVIADSVCYFHRQTTLNNIRFLSDENLLRLDDDVEALTWKQTAQNADSIQSDNRREKSTQIALRYPSDVRALHAYKDFVQNYLHVHETATAGAEGSQPVTAPLPNKKHGAALANPPWLIVVLDADSPETAADAAAAAEKRIAAAGL